MHQTHLRRFLALAVIIFTLVGIGHLLRVLYVWDLVIGSYAVPIWMNAVAFLIALSMVVMGIWHLRRIR